MVAIKTIKNLYISIGRTSAVINDQADKRLRAATS